MKRVWRILRVMALALSVLAIAVGLALRQAEAKLVESLRGFGDELANLHNVNAHSAPRRLMVNGLELKVVTASTSLNVPAALDRFQSLSHTVRQIDLPATVRQKLEERGAENSTITPLGVIRQDADTEGFLACLDVGAGLDGEGFLARLKEFGKTQNLRSLGQLRYAQARRSEGTTTLVMFWTEGDAKLAEMFPKTGDAPGSDLWDMPRPSGGRRILSAFEQGMPYGLASYEVTGLANEAALPGFQRRLDESGWRTKIAKSGTVIAEKAGRRVLVRVNEQEAGRVVISLLDLG